MKMKLSSFEIKMEVVRYATCSTSLASVCPLGRLRLTTHCPTCKRKNLIVRHVKMLMYNNYVFYIFSSLGNGHSPTSWNISYIESFSILPHICSYQKVTTYISIVHVRNMNLNQGNNDRE